jgi:hypothetical protein
MLMSKDEGDERDREAWANGIVVHLFRVLGRLQCSCCSRARVGALVVTVVHIL